MWWHVCVNKAEFVAFEDALHVAPCADQMANCFALVRQSNIGVLLREVGAKKQSDELFRYVPPPLGFNSATLKALHEEYGAQAIEVRLGGGSEAVWQ